MIRLYLKILEEFVHLILQDKFWVVHVPFVRMVKFQYYFITPLEFFTSTLHDGFSLEFE